MGQVLLCVCVCRVCGWGRSCCVCVRCVGGWDLCVHGCVASLLAAGDRPDPGPAGQRSGCRGPSCHPLDGAAQGAATVRSCLRVGAVCELGLSGAYGVNLLLFIVS